MFTTALALALANQDPITFKLDWKKGQSFKYAVSIKSVFGDSDGALVLTVSAVDDKSVTVTWPAVDMSGNMRDLSAGSQKLSRNGHLLGAEGQTSMFLIPMCLPDKPVAPGGTYVVKYPAGDGELDLKGTFTKIDSTKGRKAFLSAVGAFRAAEGEVGTKTESVFDLDRGVFLSGQMVMQPGPNTFTFKLL